MEDFKNTHTDPIPEGLEFNESYMESAFAMYDAEKQKRKRRLLIWWITSAVGFASVLLIGIYFLARNEKHARSKDRVEHSASEKHPSAHEPADKHRTISNTTSSGKNNFSVSDSRSMVDTHSASGSKTRVAAPNSATKLKTGKTNTTNTFRMPANNPKRGKNQTAGVDPSGNNNRTGSNQTNAMNSGFPNGEITTQTDAYRPVKHDSLQAWEPVQLLAKPAFSEPMPGNSIAIPSNYPEKATQAEEAIRKHHVYMGLGVNTLFGMKELKNRVTFRESVGISYSYQVNPRMAIGAGLEYHSISRVTYQRIIGDTTNSDNTTTILNKTTLNYISFLPQVNIQFLPKHQLSAGLAVEYLLLDPGERYEINNYTSESNSRTNSKLYYSTFNQYNFSASLGYSYQFSKYMSLQALYHFGFTDITKNSSLNSTFDRNSRLQLKLNIKLY